MKKSVIALSLLSAAMAGTMLILQFYIDLNVKRHISIAMEKHPGTPDEALISFLCDSTISVQERTHVALWTITHMKSQKALPVLKNLYKDDPHGKTCMGKHDRELCQYRLSKAIKAIESDPRNYQNYGEVNRLRVSLKIY
jgi:hypothetical protein